MKESKDINNKSFNNIMRCSIGANFRGIRTSKGRLPKEWSISKYRTHLSHIKEFKVISLLMPAVNIRIRSRPRVLTPRPLEPVHVAKYVRL